MKLMPDGRPDRRVHIGHTQEVLIRVPKNTLAEVMIAKKTSVTKGSAKNQRFIDFRMWFYKNGDTTREPIASRKGVQIPRRHMGRIIEAILQDLEPGELTEARINSIRHEMDRLSDKS